MAREAIPFPKRPPAVTVRIELGNDPILFLDVQGEQDAESLATWLAGQPQILVPLIDLVGAEQMAMWMSGAGAS